MPHTDEENRYAEMLNLAAYKRYRLYQTIGIMLIIGVILAACVILAVGGR